MIKAHDLTDAMAQKIVSRYIVQPRDRRLKNDRRSGIERRNTDSVLQVKSDALFLK